MLQILRTFAAAAVSAVLLFPIILVGLVIRALTGSVTWVARVLEPTQAPWTELMRYDPVLGWKPRAGLDAHYLGERDDVFRVTTDGEGWPGATSLEEADVVVVGDSFAFGYGIDPRQAYFSQATPLKVKALGVPGYSMVHGVRILEEVAPRLRGKRVVWLVFLENDLQDNLAPNMRHYRAPYLRRPSGEELWQIESGHLSPEPWEASRTNRDRMGFLAQCCTPGPIGDRAFSAAAWLIARASALCEDAGAELTVVAVPHRILLHPGGHAILAARTENAKGFDPALPDRRLGEVCQGLGVGFVPGTEVFQYSDYKEYEGIHWNTRGHTRMAGLLRKLHHSGRPNGVGDEGKAKAPALSPRFTAGAGVEECSQPPDLLRG